MYRSNSPVLILLAIWLFCVESNGVFTLDDTANETESENDSDNYGFHYNMQSTSLCTDTVSMMPLATFSLFIGLHLGIGLNVAQCEHTISYLPHSRTSSLLPILGCPLPPPSSEDRKFRTKWNTPIQRSFCSYLKSINYLHLLIFNK